jgi:protein-tyrosine phosphatase
MHAMKTPEPFVDIHCHLLPALDDGPAAWEESLQMAEMAAADGIAAIVATPHQLGNYAQVSAENIRIQTTRLQRLLQQKGIALEILPGADVRIDPDLTGKLLSGEVLTLADQRRHVLLELPHELYIPLDRLLAELRKAGLNGILSHPERNQGIINQPKVLADLVRQGCLLQVTAGSLTGAFGTRIRNFAEYMVQQGFVDFVASDAHGTKHRTPQLREAFRRVAKLVGFETAVQVFCRNPACVCHGAALAPGTPRHKNQISFSSNRFFGTTRQFANFQ